MPSSNVPSSSHLSAIALAAALWACQSPPPPSPTTAAPAPVPRAASAAPPAVAASAEPSVPPPSPAETERTSRQSEPVAELPRGTTVLHVGDSFAESLGAPLGRHLQAAGVRSVLESKTPSYIPTWAGNGDLRRLLEKHKPDLVIITLGG